VGESHPHALTLPDVASRVIRLLSTGHNFMALLYSMEFFEEFFFDRPVAVTAGCTEFPFDVTLKIFLSVVVIKQGVTHINQEHNWVRYCHVVTPVSELNCDKIMNHSE
jgi:hypothetical protein